MATNFLGALCAMSHELCYSLVPVISFPSVPQALGDHSPSLLLSVKVSIPEDLSPPSLTVEMMRCNICEALIFISLRDYFFYVARI